MIPIPISGMVHHSAVNRLCLEMMTASPLRGTRIRPIALYRSSIRWCTLPSRWNCM